MTAADVARLASALPERYRVERELGAGGMATVYLAADVRHRLKVALWLRAPHTHVEAADASRMNV